MKTALINGKVYVSRGNFAQAVLIENEIIAVVGTNEQVLALAHGCEVYDCRGKTVIPGFNDSHLHLSGIGQSLTCVSLNSCASIDEVVAQCRAFLAENPETVQTGLYSSGWNQDLFTSGEKRYLYRRDLDRISVDVPVVLSRVCGHILAANTKAIEMAGLGSDHPQVEGGLFELDSDGFPNGFFAENACGLLHGVVQGSTPEQRVQLMIRAMEYAVAHGLTSVQSNDINGSMSDAQPVFDMLAHIYESGRGLLRYRHQLCFQHPSDFAEYLETEYKNRARYDMLKNWLALGPLKLFKDGSLGARTATVRHDYLDDPGNFGVEAMSRELGEKLIGMAVENSIQVITHAIGDRAVEDMLNHYEQVICGENALRHSIVHYQCLNPELIGHTARLGVLAQVQPIFLTTDLHAVPSRFSPEMNRWFLALRTYIEKGVSISFGSDSPVEDCNPFLSIYCAVTRKDVSGRPDGGFFPEECVDVYTAVDCFTMGSAFCEFAEGTKGRINEGMLGDMVVLDTDIFTCPADKIKDILPVRTIVGGKTVYSR